jgi:hypothetical protein
MAGVNASAWVQAHPSFVEPGLVIQYNQASDFSYLLYRGGPEVKIGAEDLFVYLRKLDMRADVVSAQHASNQIQSPQLNFSYGSVPSYLQRIRAEYDHHDTANVAAWGVSIVEAERLAMWQAHNQSIRNKALYGVNASKGEGILNSPNITQITLPADPLGATTVVTYDNGAMQAFLLEQILFVMYSTNQLGAPREVTILGPQRTIGHLAFSIVQLTSFQREGAGSATVTGGVGIVSALNGVKITWGYDDTLIGKGAGGTDAVIIAIPEVEPRKVPKFNTNLFGDMKPATGACITQYADVPAPIEIPTPLAGGMIDVLTEMRVTPAVAWRPEAVVVISMQHD